MKYYFKIAVHGRGRFPLDQLRRFEMFPIDIASTQEIEASIDIDGSSFREYTLGMYAASLSADSRAIARFGSFGFVAKSLEVWRDGELMYLNGEPVDDLVAEEQMEGEYFA